MLPYRLLDYRKALEELILRARQTEPRLTYSRIAAAAKVQPTYFSNVLKGRAHFNSDQLFLVGKAIKAEREEIEYLWLLLEWSRSHVGARRSELREKIEGIRRVHLQTQKQLSVTPVSIESSLEAEYYFDPSIQIIHVYLAMPGYAKDVMRIAREIGISSERLVAAIRTLERLGFVAPDKEAGYRCLVKGRHLPHSSPVCLPHQTLMRLKSMEQMNRLPESKRHHVSVTFSTTQDAMEAVRLEFLSFLRKAETLVKGAPDEKVYQMNFDLFPWSLG